MNRQARREQLRDWNRLSDHDQAMAVTCYGLDAVPESERWRWGIPMEPVEPADCPSCGRP